MERIAKDARTSSRIVAKASGRTRETALRATAARLKKDFGIDLDTFSGKWRAIRRSPELAQRTDSSGKHYDEVARALGAAGEYVQAPADLRPALERALASGRPACVNVQIASLPSPADPI